MNVASIEHESSDLQMINDAVKLAIYCTMK